MNKKPKILVVGSFVMDFIVSIDTIPGTGETFLGDRFSMAPGGKGANQAIQAAKLGAEVTMIGKVGKDDFGKSLISSARHAGVYSDYIMLDDTQASAIGNVLLEAGENHMSKNRIIVIPGANMAIKPEEVEYIKDIIADFDMVLLQNEIPMAVNELVAEYAYEKGVPVMLNPAPAAPISDKLMSRLTYISPNEHEIEGITGIAVKTGDLLNREALDQAVKVLHQKGVQTVVVTLGSNGALVSEEKVQVLVPCVEQIKVIDPTAAGDSFIGSFCTAKCIGFENKEALEFANHTAAITVSGMGAQPSLPELSQVEALIKQTGKCSFTISRLALLEGKKEEAIITKAGTAALKHFEEVERKEVISCLEKMEQTNYEDAVAIILDAQKSGGRLHITGIGKPGHLAGYLASLLSSTGTPTYFLHGTEAVHGSCGQLMPGDVVICISNSGETSELKATVNAVKNNQCRIIGVSGNADSWLAKQSDTHLLAAIKEEGGPMNRAPRASILVEMLVLQGLSVILQEQKNITPTQYIRWHPGGALGAIRENERL